MNDLLIGWAAARGRLDDAAWVLYAMLFLWQFPHFMAIAWMYREDYSRAGYLVLPVGGNRDRIAILQSFVVALTLIPISLIPTITGKAGFVYCVGAIALGSIFLVTSARFAFQRSTVVSLAKETGQCTRDRLVGVSRRREPCRNRNVVPGSTSTIR